MFDILIKSFIAILVVSTLFIGVKQPKMHEKIQIYDSSYVVVSNNDLKTEEKVVKKETINFPTKEVTKNENVIVKKEEKIPVKEEKIVKKETSVKKQTEPVKQVQTKTNVQTQVKEDKKEQTKTVKVETPKPTVTETKKQEAKTVDEKMTQEELIAWNVWHSNIQNSLMRDVKMPYIPDGIVFKFSFTVDKYGKITNINTYSTTSKYTPYAIEYIAPVIRSYQGKSILDFPSNSERVTNYFSGGWKMSNTSSKYSSPSDYNDIEKVTK